MNAEKEINELVQKLLNWSNEYYTLDAPTVSDEVYDASLLRLAELEKENPDLVLSYSPTQVVGGKLKSGFKKVKHSSRMLSLSNAFNLEQLEVFDNNIKKHKESMYSCEPKIDGLSIAIIYENGMYKQAITRGDGKIGEDVTIQTSVISDLPKQIDYPNKLEVRGEVYIKSSDFEKINLGLTKDGLPPLANPRNAAAGALRQLDVNITKQRLLSVFMYSIPNPLDHGLKSQKEVLNFLKKLGFSVPDISEIVTDIKSAYEYCQKMIEKREKLEYEIDGIVIKSNDITMWEDIGYTVKAPKWAIAYKMPSEVVTTILKDIVPTVGRTGRITYNARLEPVRLAGTIVSNATLHNNEYISALDIRINDTVKVKKAGDIIPKVIGFVDDGNHDKREKFIAHTKCPSCDNELKVHNGEVDQYCINPECPAKLLAKISHFCSKNAMDINGMGERFVEILIDNNLIKNVFDIYELENKRDVFENIKGFGDLTFANTIDAIKKSKENSCERLLFGLGIRHVGEKASLILSRTFKSIQKIANASKEEINNINELGPKVSESVNSYFKKHIDLISNLQKYGINLEFKGADTINNIFTNKRVVITGTLSKPRGVFKNQLISFGASVSSSISPKTDYLLAGENAGSKLNKAREHNVKILSEQEYKNMIGE